MKTTGVDRAAPTTTAATFVRSGLILYSYYGQLPVPRNNPGRIRFQANTDSTLSTNEVTVSLDETFGRWFRDSASTQFGSQFTFTQQSAIQGDINAVTPMSLNLSNRIGGTTATIRQ